MERSAVIALGGNALVKKDARFASFEDQREVVEETARQIAQLMAEGWRVAITHGNGPQVGDLLLISHMAHETQREIPQIPLDAANASTQGSLGYLIAQAVRNALATNNTKNEIAAVVTQVVVDRADPAFRNPTKFVGPAYKIEEANELSIRLGWRMKEDRGRGWRRVVASPKPREIVELPVIKQLMEAGVSVVTVGGGGIPVVKEGDKLKGVAAVIDKDHASSLLVTGLEAELLAIIAPVEHVYTDFGKPTQRPLDRLSVGEAKRLMAAGQFPQGSMGPKIEAAISFLEAGGSNVLITDPPNLIRGIVGETGTRIKP
ncbi:carbamate kinase [candidate division TA06 bacterium B3_TA06]|uniref:Carbamate kinase n=1 Tax=candidate division TA06 bacterium B3_TA06 TaxID=2012487 RepID=A0A532VB29_UNCT6|nr:MAG: carbamate kinase [candidate division TA06 bacterium B3_TA06]